MVSLIRHQKPSLKPTQKQTATITLVDAARAEFSLLFHILLTLRLCQPDTLVVLLSRLLVVQKLGLRRISKRGICFDKNQLSSDRSNVRVCLFTSYYLSHCRIEVYFLLLSIDQLYYQRYRMEDRDSHVNFDVVRIHEHPILLGDNPGGLRGPPLTLDWHAQATFEMTVDDYESRRPVRRTKEECAMPVSARMEILREFGYSRREIVALTKPVNQARARRKATAQAWRLAYVEELVESVARKTKNVLTLGQRKRQERKYLESCGCFAPKPQLKKEACPTTVFTEEDNSFGDNDDAGVAASS